MAVFIPILLMGGIVGRLFREFAVTLAVAIAVSLVVSLTTTPMMCAQVPARPSAERSARPVLPRQRARLRLRCMACYDRTPALGAAPSSSLRWWSLLATIALNVYLYIIVPKGFFPQQDTGRLMGAIAGDAGHLLSRPCEQKLAAVHATS